MILWAPLLPKVASGLIHERFLPASGTPCVVQARTVDRVALEVVAGSCMGQRQCSGHDTCKETYLTRRDSVLRFL